eukprot:4003358-Amphidinium_carterae.2
MEGECMHACWRTCTHVCVLQLNTPSKVQACAPPGPSLSGWLKQLMPSLASPCHDRRSVPRMLHYNSNRHPKQPHKTMASSQVTQNTIQNETDS